MIENLKSPSLHPTQGPGCKVCWLFSMLEKITSALLFGPSLSAKGLNSRYLPLYEGSYFWGGSGFRKSVLTGWLPKVATLQKATSTSISKIVALSPIFSRTQGSPLPLGSWPPIFCFFLFPPTELAFCQCVFLPTRIVGSHLCSHRVGSMGPLLVPADPFHPTPLAGVGEGMHQIKRHIHLHGDSHDTCRFFLPHQK